MWLIGLNYSYECDWFIELSDNNLARKLVENRSFKSNQSQSKNLKFLYDNLSI